MVQVFVALLIFIAVYVVVEFLLGLRDRLKEIATPVAVVAGALASLVYLGVV